MVLVDTSIWIEHFRKDVPKLVELLQLGFVHTHEFVILELAAGSIPKRRQTIRDLQLLPSLKTLPSDSILDLVDRFSLYSKGLSMVDIHLLASSIENNVKLLTLDKKLDFYYKMLIKKIQT